MTSVIFIDAEDRTRTDTGKNLPVFETGASAIPPLRQE